MSLELYVDGEQVDLFELTDTPVKLNYLLLDLQFLDKRGGTASNVFKVPATKRNNAVFNYYYDTHAANPEKFVEPKKAILISGGVTIFDGTITGKVAYKKVSAASYEVILTANNLEWSKQLEEMPLVSLDLPTVNWDESTVRNSWGNTYTDKYVAPLACYGNPTNYHVQWNAGAQIWEAAHIGGNPLTWIYEDFRYWLFVYPMVKEMFKATGYTIQSAFIESAMFKKFIVYFNDTDIYNQLPAAINFKSDVIKAERNCLDFLKGIANRFNLMFYTDNQRKIVYIEPFDELTSGSKDMDAKADLSRETKLSQYSSILKNTVFTDQLDLMGKWQQEYIQSFYANSIYSVDLDLFYSLFLKAGFYKGGFRFFENVEDEPIESYFEGYVTGQILLDQTSVVDTYPIFMPFIFDAPQDTTYQTNSSTGLKLWKRIFPAPSGSVEPKFGYYAGMKDMLNANSHAPIGSKFKYHSDALRFERPLMYICDYAGEENGYNFHYSDQWDSAQGQFQIEYFSNPLVWPFTPRKLPGLIRKHYKNLLYSIYYSRFFEGYFKLDVTDVAGDILLKNIQFEACQWRLLEISNFNAQNPGTTLCRMLEVKAPDQNFIDALLYGGDFSLINEI